jgi:hypothetical protein
MNWLDKYKDGGELIPTAQNGIATRADSLAVYNNTRATEDYYKKQGYVKERVEDSKDHKQAIKSAKEWVSSFKKHLNDAKNNPVGAFYTQTDKNKNIAEYKKYVKEAQKRLSETIDQVDPKKYLKKLEESKKIFEEKPKDKGRYVDEQNNLVEGKPSIEKFYLPVDENKFYQREQSQGFLDLRSPMPLYDKRIAPQYLSEFKSPDLILQNQIADKMHKAKTKKEIDALAKQHAGIAYADKVEMYEYDPLAVMPFDMVPPELQEERVKKYGLSGVPKSIIDMHPEWLENTNQTTSQPIKTKTLQPMVKAVNLPPMQPLGSIVAPTISDVVRFRSPKSYNVNMQRYNMVGPSDYYQANEEGVDYERAVQIKAASDAYNRDIEKRYGPQNEYRTPKSAEKAAERLKQLRSEFTITPNYQMGGSIPGSVGFTYARTNDPAPSNGKYAKKTMASAQEGKTITIDEGDGKKRKILTDSKEYFDLFNEKRIGVKNDDGSISFNPLNEVVVTPYDKQYPFYQELSDEEKKYFNSDSPIGRQLRSRAEDNVGFNADKATDFAMGWLRDIPLASLQAPQSALVETVEALKGNDFNMLNALDPSTQRIPSETWGVENPYAAFAVDALTDPEILMGMPLLKNPLQKGIKQLKNIPTSIAPELRQGVNTNGFLDMFKSKKPITSSTENLTQTTVPKPWEMQELPGLHLQSTMDNGAISKIVEPKTGMVNVEQALAIIRKETGGADKVALIKQGLGENIPKKMDFNEFRKKVQDQLIPLETKINPMGRSEYGLHHIGYDDAPPMDLGSLTFSNKNKFGRGSSAHGNPDETLGHAHFLRDAETPDVLTVTQIQSDAFQGTHRIMPKNTPNATVLEKQQKSLQRMQELQERNKAILNKMKTEGVDDAGLPVQDYQIKQFEDIVKAQEESNLFKKADVENFTQKQLLDKNHQERYLQELVDYAGKRGDVNKVRVPTSETAAKVQGYTPISELNKSEEFINLRKNIVEALDKHGNNSQQYKKANEIYEQAVKNSKHSYSSEHQTILKKYSEQPKTIKKLFGEEPKIVTDSKGNTWYEFDIPKKFKEGKGEIKAFSTIGAIGTAGTLSQMQNEEPTQEMKQGGVIKDDNGYWNPDNWGSPVEINSNNITMEGVYEPLLGISDTGDTKLMQPGKDYKFKGKKVTEYPLAKDGKELVKLNQLTNFTNYNTKQSGGWLDKYSK